MTERDQGLQQEYELDYSKSTPNRFAGEVSPECIAIVLDPDVAAVFHDSVAVNSLLRSVIAAMPSDFASTAKEP